MDELSKASLFLQLSINDRPLEKATGFIIRIPDRGFYLITNWHVLSGRNPIDEQPRHTTGAIPDAVSISYHHHDRFGEWVVGTEGLFTGGVPRWIEHRRGRAVDIVALPLDNIPDTAAITTFALGLSGSDLVSEVGMPVFMIGFPFGIGAGGKWPIWKAGNIASEPDIDYRLDEPAFLVDATTRPGMSGSPVVIRMNAGYHDHQGALTLGGPPITKFVGIYSGRIHENVTQGHGAELGRVWRPTVIDEIIAQIER